MTIDGTFRTRLLAGEFLSGFWLNLGSPVSAEMAGLAGFDWVLLDHEHGAGGEDTLLHQLQAVSATPACRANATWSGRASSAMSSSPGPQPLSSSPTDAGPRDAAGG